VNRKSQAGQAMAEYLLCTSVLVVALLVPWFADQPVVLQWAQALRNAWRLMSWLLALS
jgi:hypothetical protein